MLLAVSERFGRHHQERVYLPALIIPLDSSQFHELVGDKTPKAMEMDLSTSFII
jgi:hypothetical protein